MDYKKPKLVWHHCSVISSIIINAYGAVIYNNISALLLADIKREKMKKKPIAQHKTDECKNPTEGNM